MAARYPPLIVHRIPGNREKVGFPELGSKAFLGFEEQGAELREKNRVEVVACVEPDTGLVPYLLVLVHAHRSPGWSALLCIHARRGTERTPALSHWGLCREWLEAPAVGIFAFRLVQETWMPPCS